MAFEDLIVGGDDADEPTAVVSPDLIATRNERKGLTDFSARARQPVDFGTDDEVIGPAPKARQQALDFGTDDEVIGSAPIKNPPMPRARPAEAPGLIQPTQAMPEVQPLDNAPFRAPSSGMDTNMLTGDEAYAERQASISGAQAGVAEAEARLEAAKSRSASIADGSTRAQRRGTTGDLQRQSIQAEIDAATANLDQAKQALSAAERAAPPTQTKTRDAASRFATAVGTAIPDVIGGIARPIDAGLDAVGIEGGTGIAEKMRGISRKVGLENQPDPVREEELNALLGQGGGSAIGFVVTGAIGKAAKIPAAFASGGAGAAQNAEQYYREADDMGAPAYKKALAYAVGAGIGATEAIGLGRIADELDKKTGGGLKRYFGLVAKEMGEEGLQEAGQQLLDNLAKLGLYGKDPGDITAGVAQGALVGMILGGGMAGTLGLGNLTAGRDRAAREGVPLPEQAPITPEEIIRQILGAPSTPPATQPMPGPTPGIPASVTAPSQMEEPPVPPQAQEITPQPSNVSALPAETAPEEITPPAPSNPVEKINTTAPDDAALLRGYGYTDEQIADMSPEQIKGEVEAAKEAGTEPVFGEGDAVVGSRSEPVKVETPADLDRAAGHVNTSPTEAQKEAGTYAKGHVKWNGLDITIETPKGAERSGKGADGESWSVAMPGHYGYIRRTVGKDGDQVDVTFGDDPKSSRAFIVDQFNPETGRFDEHKLFVGYPDLESATLAYDLSFSDGSGPQRRKAVSELSVDQLKGWLRDGNTKKAYSEDVSRSGQNADVQALAQREGSLPQSQEPVLPQLRGAGDQAASGVGEQLSGLPGRSGAAPVAAAHARPEGQREGLRAGQRGLGDQVGAGAEHAQDMPADVSRQDAVGTSMGARDRAASENGAPQGGSRSQRGRSAVAKLASDGPALSLLQFIASKGGLRPDPELTAIGLSGSQRVNVPGRTGRFAAMRPTGMSIDQMREAAEEAGYFRGTGEATSSPREFLDAIDNELRGQRRLPEGQEAEPSKREIQRLEDENANRDALLAQNRAEIEAMLEAYGVPAGMTNEADLKLAAEIMADEDLDPDAALERAAMRNLENDPSIPQETVYDAFDFGAFDAVQPQPTPEDERGAEAESAAGVRPGEEGAADEPVEHVSGAGEDREGPGEGEAREEAERAEQPREEVPERVESVTEQTEAGEQAVLPGAEKESQGKQAQRKAEQPLKPKVAQKPADEGLFGDDKDQRDLLDPNQMGPSGYEPLNTYNDDQRLISGKSDLFERGDANDEVKSAGQYLKELGIDTETKARESGPSDSEDLDLDSIIDQAIDKYAPEEKPAPKKRTAGNAAKSAAKNTAMGLAEVAKGLDALFSPKGKLGAGPSFDEETYAKAKPFFMAGVAHFAEAGRDIKAMIDELVKHLVQTAGMGREAIVAMRPYLKQFAQDVASGAIDLSQQETDNGAAESADERSGTESAGQEALDGVPAEEGGGTASAGDVGRGAAGSGDLGADGDRAAQEPGLSGERGEGGGAAEVPPAAAGAGRGRAGARARRDGSRVSEAPAGAEGRGRGPADQVTPAEAPNLPAVNYRITDETELGQGSEGVKFRDNIAAIETLKTIERENRRATPAEQRTLARYVGWGGLANAFRDTDGNLKADWKERGEQLEQLLTKDELTAARRSTRNAHYTSRTVVDAMWEAARHLGFKGGLALELSSGTGNFLGLVPEEIAGNTRFVAVEFDSITARIAKVLYPQDTVLHSGLHKLPLPEGEAVLNIGNPPFGSESLRFQYKPELNGLSIHNQFFLAGLDALQPGGLQILVVSRYLMDAQDTRAREMLAKKAKLLGAIRLPETAFKENARTEVVTDILFLQRHTAAEEEYAAEQFENAKDERKVSNVPDWVKTTTVRDPLGGEPMVVNSYFARKPSMVMGKLERSGSMRTKDEVNVTLAKGADLGAMLRKAIQTLPRNVLDLHQDVMDATLKRYQTMGESLEIALAGHEIGHVEQTDGKLYQISERETPTGGYEPVKRAITPDSPWSRQLLMDSEGRWYTLEPKVDAKGAKVKSGARNVYERKYFEGNVVPAAMRLGKAKYDKLKALVDLRDLTKRQLTLEAEDAPAAEMEGNRKKIADAYQSFVGSNGYLNDAGNLRLLNDLPDGALVLALETGYRAPVTHAKAARTGETAKPASAKPAPIMSRRVVPKYEPATRAETAQDALSISLSEVGHADMDRIAQLLGKTREEAIEELTAGDKPLLYKDPETGAYETANGYLSGNVVRKLKAAEAAGLTRNVEALQKVQPERWSAENISAMPGANWIPPQVYADFATHLFGVPAKVHYSQVTNSFNLYVDDYSREKADQWGTADIPADAILRGILNSRVPKVMREDGEGRKYVDQEATALVSLKAKEVENEFADWVFADSARRNLLTDIYNEKFNTRVNRQHDGSHLALPGKVPDEVIKLRRHQKNAVWRGIYERFMLLDHVVGAGKTFTAIARVMERRRMGLSRKPMIVVPNHLVDQWTADVYRLYPGAKVLAAGKNQFDKKNRRRLFAKIATGDWDVVIVPHSSFGFIGISPETERRFLEEELRIAQEAVQEAQDQAAADGIGGRSKPFTVKEAERLVTTIEGRLDALKKSGRDNMLTFEQMGVDDLTVDEAHEFKNLFYSSRLTGVRGMGDKSGSQKAFDLYNKVRVLRDSPNGTVTFMTGTPISNSAVEMYTMMRYLSAQDLKDLGIEHFDAWRSQYVSATAKFEPTEAGGLKEVTRLGRNWSNMRALMELYYSFTDAVSQEDINRWYAEDNDGARFPVPKVKTGGRKEVVVKPTEAQSAMLRDIVAGFNGLQGISDPYERNAERLRLMDRARKVSLDVRAADATVQSDEAGGKLDQIADKIADIYDRTKADAGTQLVFIDRSVPAAKSDKKVIKDYDDLIARRDAALAAGEEAKYRDLVEQLEKFDANEIETLRAAQKGGWNAYDQLKANLTARGIPADEIRFVQEANNDAEKKALFDAVNDGTVRVLIGSTPRMGAGTNVQERLVALHHGDVTWKPSDIEQREGRIIRQGNKLLEKYGADNFEVDILAYVTERTVDAKMWDLNATKLKMINGIRKYDGAFNMEFEDEDSVGMAEIAALASGDPLLLERVKLIAEIDKLELLERAHRRKMFGIDDAIYDLERAQKNYPAMIEAGKVKAAAIQSAIDTVRRDAAGRTVEVEGKSYSTRLDANNAVEAAIEAAKAGDEHARYAISINGQRVTNREMAQALLNEAIGDPVPIEAVVDGDVVRSRTTFGQIVARKATELLQQTSRDTKKPVRIGKMLGYNLELGVYPDAHRISLALTDNGATIVDVEQPYGHDAKGFVPQSGRALIDKLEGEIDYEASFTGKRLQDKINEAETRLPSLREERGKPFQKAEELKGLRDRLEEVIKTLDQRTKDAESGRGLPEEVASVARVTSDVGRTAKLDAERRENIERALTDVVRKIAGPSVPVRFVDELPINMPAGWGSFGQDKVTAAGSYIPARSLITVALADPAYPLEQVLDTTFHEAFHALEDKILTEQEMDVLKREDARLREIVKRAYGFTAEQISEIAGFEIRAMAFEYYASRRARGLEPQGLHIGIRRAFERLLDLFRRVRNVLNGLGYQNASDIFEAAFDGAYADRRGAATATVTEQANIRQVQPQGNLNRFESYEPLPERWQDWWKRPDLNWRDRAWGMLDAAFLRANRALGDRYVDMRRLQAAVELTGRQVNEGVNMALAATLFEGRTEKRLKDYWTKLWKPALDFAYSQGVTREELHQYLYARHAPERNAHIADINPMMPEGGSGMTDAEAQAIMDAFAAAGKLEALEQVAQRIDGIVRQIRGMMVNDQLEHEETIGQWEQAYQHYVPLRGFESGDEDMAQDLQVSRTGKGFDVRGPETKQALGRSSKADDILTNLFLMGERTIIRGEQNRVGRTAMRFMQSNPQPSLYEVSRSERVLTDGRVETTTENDIDLLDGERPITVRRINRDTGLVETVTRVASAWANDSFAVKVGGHTYYIRIKHPGLLTALKNVGIQRLPWLIQAHSWLTRQFSAFRTARNPDFFVPNLFRDVQDAAYTLGAEQRSSLVKNFALNIGTLRTYVAAFIGELMESNGAIGDLARRKLADKRGAQLYEDWKKHGGQIAFMGINDLDSARREIEAAFHETEESYASTVAKAPYRLARSILKAIEFFNGAIEAGTRLAVYDAALKAGMTKNKAAELSKESTTNFNRKGIYSPYLNAFYAFFNARVQGATKIVRLLRNSKMARRAAIGLVVGGFATTLWNLTVSPEDEDKKPEYMRRKYWERERYFIFYIPGAKDPVRIPMGYGLQLFWMLGENLAMVSQGKITPAQAAANYLSTIVSAFSPVQAEGSATDPGTWLRYIMPSVEMPLLELGTNEDWRRKPIHPKFGKKGEPHSEQYFSTTSPYAIDVAQFLNKVSGGNAFKPGAVDFYPGDLQYVWNFATGGLGQTTNRTTTLFNNWLEGVPTPPNQVPILRHFVGANVEQATGEAYYEARDEVQRGMAQVRKAMKAPAASDDAAKTIEEGANRYGLQQGKRRGTVGSDAETIFRNADKQIKGLRALEQAARQDKTLDTKSRAETIKDLRQQMRDVQEAARKAYREIKKRESSF
jgi:N12 class adenine-specific DNA methylase